MFKNFAGPYFLGLDLQDRTASIAVPTTPTLIKPPVVVAQSGGLEYDPVTGIVSGVKRAVYATVLQFNVNITGNTSFFFYAEIDAGAGFQPNRFSARKAQITNATQSQIVMASSNDFIEGLKFRFFFWADSACNLVTQDLPGTPPGTLTVPAVRILIAGS